MATTPEQLVQAKNNALGTIYGSGKDLANAQATYGNNYNYQNLVSNPNTSLKQGDIVVGGSAVTPNITDDMINKAGASRVYGNDASGTLSAMQNNAKSVIPQTYQTINNNILSSGNYGTLTAPDIASGYKTLLTNSLNSNSSSTANYQNQVQNALNSYNSATKINPEDTQSFKNNMTNSINNLYNTQKENVPLYYQTGIDQAKQQYAGLRNQASVINQQNSNKLKESMASQGLFNSGDNITAQTGINNQYANDLSGYNKQEQNYYDTTNNAIAQQKAAYDAQAAQALIDLGYQSDTRDFNLASLYDNRNQQQFQNSMSGINSMYGMSQDQFNNVLKTMAQQYGMDQDAVQNSLNYAQFNANQDQRQISNGLNVNNANYGIYNDTVKNNQWDQTFDYSKSQDAIKNEQWQKQFDTSNSQWQQQFDYKKQQDALANQLAQARLAASGSSGRSGGSRSSRSSTSQKEIDNQAISDFNNSSVQTQYGLLRNPDFTNSVSTSTLKSLQSKYEKNLGNSGLDQSLVTASQPTWNYQKQYNGTNTPIYGRSR